MKKLAVFLYIYPECGLGLQWFKFGKQRSRRWQPFSRWFIDHAKHCQRRRRRHKRGRLGTYRRRVEYWWSGG